MDTIYNVGDQYSSLEEKTEPTSSAARRSTSTKYYPTTKYIDWRDADFVVTNDVRLKINKKLMANKYK